MLFTLGWTSDRVKCLRDVNQYAAGGRGIVARRTPEGMPDGRFDGPRPAPVSGPPGARQRQTDPARIGNVCATADQACALEAREDTGQRRGVKV